MTTNWMAKAIVGAAAVATAAGGLLGAGVGPVGADPTNPVVGTVSRSGSVVTVLTANNVASDLTIARVGPFDSHVSDSASALSAGPGCEHLSTFVDCGTGVTKFVVWAGNLNDVIDVSNAHRATELHGGDGMDWFVSGPQGDVMYGGPGVDVADFSHRDVNLVIDIDGVRDDGATGENDNVGLDMEYVLGGSGNDVIKASATESRFGQADDPRNLFYGNGGTDVLYGYDGNDDLVAGTDPGDTSYGGTGVDSCGAKVYVDCELFYS